MVVNYFEWVQNRMGYSWLDAVVAQRFLHYFFEGCVVFYRV